MLHGSDPGSGVWRRIDQSGSSRHADTNRRRHPGVYDCPLFDSSAYVDAGADVHADSCAAHYRESRETGASYAS
jgi:hypothetical protein